MNKRLLVKTLIWIVLGCIILGFFAFLITKNSTDTALLILSNQGIQVITYLCYERLWEKIGWGKL